MSQQIEFGGETYDPAIDGNRLRRQFGKVREAMLDGRWHTLSDLAQCVGAPEASVSARLRDLRKEQFGGYYIERRRTPHEQSGRYEYRLLVMAS